MSGRGGIAVLAATAFAGAVLIGLYIGLGGASYQPMEVADPCDERPIEAPEGIEMTLQQLALSALDGAACELRITREDLTLALADPEGRERFLDERRISDENLEAAVRGGLDRAFADAVEVGAIGDVEALLIGQAIERIPIDVLVDIAQSESTQAAAAFLAELAASEGAQDAVDALEGLLD